jgi:hypothetical protein
MKSYIFTKICTAYNPDVAKDFWDTLQERFFSDIACKALTDVFLEQPVTFYPSKHGKLTEAQLHIAAYIDSLKVDDYAKSVFIKKYAAYEDNSHHEAVKRELALFVKYVNE